MKRLSIVITNYDNEPYLGEAIDSALGLQWDDIEVIVVDDGSTDDSLEVIHRYGSRLRVLATENAGQRVAANRGFALSSGDAVIFLDSDDTLPPELPLRLAQVWGPRVSKVQFQVRPMNAVGHPLAAPYPAFDPVPSADDIRRWVTRTSAYPTPPGSANAYARWCLEAIFPLDETIGPAADSGCLAAAPMLGDVVTVPGVLIGYRWHDGQLSDLLSDPRRFAREVSKARGRWRLANRVAGTPDDAIDEAPLFRSRELLQFRIAARRLDRSAPSPLPGEGLLVLWRDVLRSPWHTGPESLWKRFKVGAWCALLLSAPSALVPRLLRRRYARRPRSGALGGLGSGPSSST